MMIGAVLMSVAISIGISPQGQKVIDRWQEAPRRVVKALDDGIELVLADAERHLKTNLMRGAPGSGSGGNTPVGGRSGALRQAVTHQKTGLMSGFVGTTEGVTSKYARAILGPDTTTIKPKSAKHLWIPIADNLNPSGQARFTPRAAMDAGARIFKSKRGNTVVFLPTGGRFKRATKAGRQKGQQKGMLLFVLKDQVVIHGTDALAIAINQRAKHASEILNRKLEGALP